MRDAREITIRRAKQPRSSRSQNPGLYLDPVRARVGPVQVAGHPVHCDAVGVVELRVDQGGGLAPVDARAPDGLDLVVGPVHVTVHGVVVYGDGVPDVLDLGAGDHSSPVKRVCECGCVPRPLADVYPTFRYYCVYVYAHAYVCVCVCVLGV